MLFAESLYAQQGRVYGYVYEQGSGEPLFGAHVFDTLSQRGTTTDAYGYFSLTILAQKSCIQVSYIGYDTYSDCQLGAGEKFKKIYLNPNNYMDAVEVKANRLGSNMTLPGVLELQADELLLTPQAIGEADVLKALALQPGISIGVEGTSSLFIRGSSPDQTLILLDDAPVYNATHLASHFSIFNPDAIRSVRVMKSGMPALYGGRVSSLLDIRLKEGNLENWRAKMGIGLISSRLTLEGPLWKNKISLIMAVRSSYLGLFAKKYDPDRKSSSQNYWLYDLNGKLSFHINDRHKLFFSIYSGLDHARFGEAGRLSSDYEFGYEGINTKWGNSTATIRYHGGIASNITINSIGYFTRYHYLNSLEAFEWNTGEEPVSQLDEVKSMNEDKGWKLWLNYYAKQIQVNVGAEIIDHTFLPQALIIQYEPGLADTISLFNRMNVDSRSAFLGVLLFPNAPLSLDAGLRWSSYLVTDTSFQYLEPRIFMQWRMAANRTFKAGFSQATQPLHLLSGSGISLPNDVWVGSSRQIPPQKGWQLSGGFYFQQSRGKWTYSVEGFYKRLEQLIDFMPQSNGLDFSNIGAWEQYVEKEGKGRIFGIEQAFQIEKGRAFGQMAYTLSWNSRQFDRINKGEPFPFRFDRRHDLALTGGYQLNAKWRLSAAWVYQTGYAITVPAFTIPRPFQGGGIEIIQEVNGGRMPAYHRLDVSAQRTWQDKKKKEHGLLLSIYNVYNRVNPYFIRLNSTPQFENGQYKGERIDLVRVGLYPFLPGISYHISF